MLVSVLQMQSCALLYKTCKTIWDPFNHFCSVSSMLYNLTLIPQHDAKASNIQTHKEMSFHLFCCFSFPIKTFSSLSASSLCLFMQACFLDLHSSGTGCRKTYTKREVWMQVSTDVMMYFVYPYADRNIFFWGTSKDLSITANPIIPNSKTSRIC